MHITDKIRELIEAHGITQKEFNEDVHISKNTLRNWEKAGSVPSSAMNTIKAIADYFRVPMEYLIEDDADKIDSSAKIEFEAIPVRSQTMLPVYGEVSAGSGEFAQQLILGYEVADAKYDPKEYFYLIVDGDSMSPLIDDGDYVLVHSQETIESGQIAVCVVDGFGYVKKVERTEDSITLISINPYYPPRTFKRYDMNRVRIYGRVLEMKRKF